MDVLFSLILADDMFGRARMDIAGHKSQRLLIEKGQI